MTTLRWSGFADLVFPGSARLALARAVERAGTDVVEKHPDAWLVEDRRIAFALADETGRAVLESVKRLLEELVDAACGGEAYIETANPVERWARNAKPPMNSEQVQIASEDADSTVPTTRSAAS